MPDPHAPAPETVESGKNAGSWLTWLAWGWLLLLALAAVADLSGWEDLRLALDFQRHFR